MFRLIKFAVILSMLAMVSSSAVCLASEAETVSDKRYEVFMTNPLPGLGATTMTFRADNILIIEGMDGAGIYMPVANTFNAFYWAPEYYMGDDITLWLTGFTINPFIFAFGIARVGNDPRTVLLTGYVLSSE